MLFLLLALAYGIRHTAYGSRLAHFSAAGIFHSLHTSHVMPTYERSRASMLPAPSVDDTFDNVTSPHIVPVLESGFEGNTGRSADVGYDIF